MRILKFGGTSVGNSENLQRVAKIVEMQMQEDEVLVVVSALGGITDQLTLCAELAASGDEDYKRQFPLISERHGSLVGELFASDRQPELDRRVSSELSELRAILDGVFLIGELSDRTRDRILSFGEVLSSLILFAYLKQLDDSALFLDARELILTDDAHGAASVDQELTYERIKQTFRKPVRLSVSPGFIGSCKVSGAITTLGRGGSDYSAALYAAALDASELQIWTDVSGMMTCDPRLVSHAHTIAHLSYEEAMELTHFGAKVLYPPTIIPALQKKIPIRIRNTFKPNETGTTISAELSEDSPAVKGITSITDVALCTFSGVGLSATTTYPYRFMRALYHNSIKVYLITQASSQHAMSVCVDLANTYLVQKAFREEFADELATNKVNELQVHSDLSLIALVGSRIRTQTGIINRMFETLSYNGIDVRAMAQGSSELNISVAIDRTHLGKALNVVHEAMFLSRIRKFNLFMIGVGNVGKAFLDQIEKQQRFLEKAFRINLNIAGLANSRKMLFSEDPISPSNGIERLNEVGQAMDLDLFKDTMVSMNLRNSIFIDCTASSDVAAIYGDILQKSISVVTPNKIACSSGFDTYLGLKKTATAHNARFLFETNVGAGLPVVSTVSDLLKSGDKIHRIDAVLSGTLNFVFNTYDGSTPFSEVIRKAREGGYTEPDPRVDLSGIDVMRKILILARESGYKLELDDIEHQPFVPEACMNTDGIESFYDKLDEYDQVFKDLYNQATEAGKRLKFVASFDNRKIRTGLDAFGSDHPFYDLKGKDNIVLFYTNRYNEQPLVVRGAGAGADVTASGIFADVMRITSN